MDGRKKKRKEKHGKNRETKEEDQQKIELKL